MRKGNKLESRGGTLIMTLMGAKLNTKVLQKWLFELNKGHFGIEFPNVQGSEQLLPGHFKVLPKL